MLTVVTAGLLIATWIVLGHVVWRLRRWAMQMNGWLSDECERASDRIAKLEARDDLQAKQIAGLQNWCQNIDRLEDELLRLRPADPESYVSRTYPKRADEV